MRVLACLLLCKENFSQSVVAPRGPIGRESALAWADRYAGMGHAPRNPCFTYDAPSQKFPYKPKSCAIISQIDETFRLLDYHFFDCVEKE